MILGCLYSSTLREHTKYLGQRMRIHLRPLTTLTREGGIFASLWQATPTKNARDACNNAWISADIWRLVYMRFSIPRYPMHDQALIWRLRRTIKVSLKADRRRRTEEAGSKIESLLDSEPSPSQGSMEPDEGVVKGYTQHSDAARLSNPRADCSGSGHAIFPTNTPRREYYHIC